MMPVKYAELSDVKDYLEMPADMAEYDNKLQMILDGVNMLCEDYTGETEHNALLKLSVCQFVEFKFNKTTGAESEGDKDVSIKFTTESIPPEVKSTWDRFVDEDDDPGGATIENF